jgi:proline iminopeptidase
VTELVLRGIFLFDQYELDWLYRKGGASQLYPDKWDEFVAPIPQDERDNLVQAYRKRLTGSDEGEQLRRAKAWSKWEAQTVTLLPTRMSSRNSPRTDVAIAIARIENHYMANGGWLEEGQLLRGAEKLRGIPGGHRPGPARQLHAAGKAAWALKNAWPEVELQIIPDGGHLFNEPGMLDGANPRDRAGSRLPSRHFEER